MKAVCLLSGGIDSPVAVQIAIDQMVSEVALLHYHNYPFNSLGTLEKVIALANALAEKNSSITISLAIMVHGKTQELILNALKGRDIRQTCLFCRMQMFSKAETFARGIGADAVITGEIMGEQASQTLDNLPIVTSKVDIITLRPLLGYNKNEVIHLAQEWGYYDLSILPGGCCSINPKYPETRGQLAVVEPIYEEKVNEISQVAKQEIETVETFSLPISIDKVLAKIEI